MEKLKENFATLAVSSAIIVSAILSAYSIYIEKESYMDGTSIYFQAGMFIVLGIIVSLGFWTIEEKVKKHKDWVLPVIFALILSSFWLLISPKQNAFAFNHREAVVNEIKEQYEIISSTTRPFIDRFETYKKIAGELKRIAEEIRVMRDEQSLTGQGEFYNMLNNIYTDIGPNVRDFSRNYGKVAQKEVSSLRENLQTLSSLEYKVKKDKIEPNFYFDNESEQKTKKEMLYNSHGLITVYNSIREDIQSSISRLKYSDDPNLILQDIRNKLLKFKNLVISVQHNTNSGKIKKIADDTLRRINPLVNGFSMKVKLAEEKTLRLQERLSNIDKVTFNNITLNVALVDKHWLKYYPTYLGTQLLDYIPILFMFFRIIILVKNRKRLYLEAEKDKIQKKVDRKSEKLEEIAECKTRICKELKEKEKKLEDEEQKKREDLEILEKERDDKIGDIEDSLTELKIKLKSDITQLNNKEIIAKSEVGGDYSELQKVINDYIQLKANVDLEYDENTEIVKNQLEDFKRNYQREREHLEEVCNTIINNLIDEIKDIEERIKTKTDAIKKTIEEFEEDIEDLDDKINDLLTKEYKNEKV